MTNQNLTNNHSIDVDYSAAVATRFIGREQELKAIDHAARADSPKVVQVIGEGGAGKTRLLKEIVERYCNQRERFLVAGEVVDFYHIATHSVEGLMDAISHSLRSCNVRLDGYEAARRKLDHHLAEPPTSGGGSLYPNLLKGTGDALITDLNRVGGEKRLVLVFDTAEKLLYDITEVEHALGLTHEQLDIWRWFCNDFLPYLRNSLVIIAGRPKSALLLDDLKSSSIQAMQIPLGDFNETDALAYFAAVAETIEQSKPILAQRIRAWSENDRRDIIRKTAGRPILLALTIDCLAVARGGLNLPALPVDLKSFLVRTIQSTDRSQDDTIRAVARARKGMTSELLARLLELKISDGNWDIASANKRLDAIRDLSFVKSFSNDRLFLHDEMYDLIDRYILSCLSPQETGRANDIITAYCHERVDLNERELDEARSKLTEARLTPDRTDEAAVYQEVRAATERLRATMLENLHYQLRANALEGFETYYRYAEEVLDAGDMELDAQLRAELLVFWDERDPNGNATEVDGLRREQLRADGAIRWVRRRIKADEYRSALELVDALEKNHLISAGDPLSRLDLELWKLSALVYTENAPERIETPLQDTIAALEMFEDSWRVSVLLGHIYNRLGYLKKYGRTSARCN